MWYADIMTMDSYNFTFVRQRELKRKLFLIACIFLLTLLCLQAVFHFLLCPMFVLSSSMKPGLAKNSAVFVLPVSRNRPGIFSTGNLNRGEIVRIEDTEESELNAVEKITAFSVAMLSFQRLRPFALSSSRCPASSLFRLIGLPGDTLYIKDYVAYVKKEGSAHFLTEFELSSADYNIYIGTVPALWDTDMGAQRKTKPITLGKDEYFVLCDNRSSAFDSRLFGAVDVGRISGKVLVQYYPFTDVKKLY